MSILCMADSVSASDTANNFIINLDDTSPVIVYSASEDASQSSNFSAGWIVSGPSTGTGLHSTAADGASLTLQWNGEYKLFHFGVIFRGMVKGNLHYSAYSFQLGKPSGSPLLSILLLASFTMMILIFDSDLLYP